MEHTKTPWHDTGLPDSCGYKAINGDTHNVCVIHHDPNTIKEQKANAEFIVKACNSHDALVEALQGLKDAFIHTDGNTRGNKAKTNMISHNQHDVPAALTAARYALEQAK